MSASELQACLARLYVDESFRKLFYVQPEILSDYGLEAAERDALLQVDRRALDFFAGSLRNKRRKRIARAYPALFRLDGPILERYYRRYYSIFTSRSGTDFRSEIDAFGTFLWESLIEEGDLPPYARELARYEQLDFLARSLGEHREAAHSILPEVTICGETRPYIADGVTLCRFRYDIPVIEEALLQGGPEEALAVTLPGDYAFAFFPPRSIGGTRMLRLNGPLALVLESCDGVRSITEIVAEVERRLAAHALMEPIVDTLRRCAVLGVVSVAMQADGRC